MALFVNVPIRCHNENVPRGAGEGKEGDSEELSEEVIRVEFYETIFFGYLCECTDKEVVRTADWTTQEQCNIAQRKPNNEI